MRVINVGRQGRAAGRGGQRAGGCRRAPGVGVGGAAGSGVPSCLGSFRPLIPEAGAGLWPAALPEFAGGPKYGTEQIEDGLVLVLAAGLVSAWGGSPGHGSPPPQLCKAQTCPLPSVAKPSSAARDRPGFLQRKPGPPSAPQTCLGAFLPEPRVPRSIPRAVTAKNSPPCTPCRPRLLLLGWSRAAPAPSAREVGTNPAPSTQLQPPPPAAGFDFVCVFVCF